MIEERSGKLFITLRVQPKASRNAHKVKDGVLKVWLTAPPVEGRANAALVEYLSKVLGVPKSSLSIVRGERGRDKVVAVEGISLEDAKERLGC